MTRSVRGSLRIRDGLDIPGTNYDVDLPAGHEAMPQANPVEKLTKLFPVEGAMLYPVGMALAGNQLLWRAVCVALLAFAVIGLRALATRRQQGGKPDWIAVFVSTVSFVLYAASLGAFGLILGEQDKHTLAVVFITVIWLAFIPYWPTKPAFQPTTPNPSDGAAA